MTKMQIINNLYDIRKMIGKRYNSQLIYAVLFTSHLVFAVILLLKQRNILDTIAISNNKSIILNPSLISHSKT